MIGVMESGEGTVIASFITYIILALIPILMLIFGLVEKRRGDAESLRVAKAMYIIAGLSALVIVGFFIITAL